jgi:hypothetical protein
MTIEDIIQQVLADIEGGESSSDAAWQRVMDATPGGRDDVLCALHKETTDEGRRLDYWSIYPDISEAAIMQHEILGEVHHRLRNLGIEMD